MPRKVLYIDDDAGLCALVKRSLGREGIEVVTATDGESGLKVLGDNPDVDIVAVDLYMPGLGGMELTERVNAMPNHPPVIVVTGAQDSRMAVAALKAGAFDYVVKDVQGDFTYLLKASFQAAAAAMRMRRAKEAAEEEVRAARDRFEALAAERALLMREVNHRVGNSLQLIASLLTIQSNAAANAEVKEALSDATGRVMAVAQVHRRLYTSDDVQSVAVDLYLEALVEDLRRSTAAEGGGLAQLTLQADPMAAAPDHAVALGMIVNELVTNALKYAYPEEKGAIRVILKRDGDNRGILSVEDDGVGNSFGAAAHAKATSTGLGQRIVHAMGDKLRARIEHDSSPHGTRVTVSFDLFGAPALKTATAKPAA